MVEQAKGKEAKEPVSAIETAGAVVDLKLTNANGSLPAHVSEEAREVAMELATKLATLGLGPDHKAHGFTLIFGDSEELLRRDEAGNCVYGECAQDHFNYAALDQQKDVRTKEGFAQIKSAGEQDGAMVSTRRP